MTAQEQTQMLAWASQASWSFWWLLGHMNSWGALKGKPDASGNQLEM